MAYRDEYLAKEAKFVLDHYFHNLSDTLISKLVSNENGLFPLDECVEKIPSLREMNTDVLLKASMASRFVSCDKINNRFYLRKRNHQEYIKDHLNFWFGRNYEKDYFLQSILSRNGGVAPIEKVANFGSFSLLGLTRESLINEIRIAAAQCNTVAIDETKCFLQRRSNYGNATFSLNNSQRESYQRENHLQEEKQREYQRKYQQQTESAQRISAASPSVNTSATTSNYNNANHNYNSNYANNSNTNYNNSYANSSASHSYRADPHVSAVSADEEERLKRQRAIEERLAMLDRMLKEEEEKQRQSQASSTPSAAIQSTPAFSSLPSAKKDAKKKSSSSSSSSSSSLSSSSDEMDVEDAKLKKPAVPVPVNASAAKKRKSSSSSSLTSLSTSSSLSSSDID